MIGSGASGLAAAFRLQQAGHQVRILEQADRIGSTLRSRRRQGYLLDQGAFFLTSAHARMLRIVEEAGMLDQMVPAKLVVGTLRDGTVHELSSERFLRDLRRTKLLSPRAKLRLLRLAPDVRRARRHLGFDGAPRTAGRDGENVEQWARRRLGREVAEHMIGPSMRALYAAPPETRPPVDLMAAIRLLLGAQLLAPREGMGAYAEMLAERFAVELRAEALEVVEDPEGVTLTWRDSDAVERVEPVDAVVLAVPAAAVRRMMPGLDEWRSRYLSGVREGHVINANVASSSAPRGIGATYVQIPRRAHPFLGGIVLDHNKAPERAPAGAGLLTLVALGDWSEAHMEDDDAQVGRALLNALESVLPGAIHDVRFVEINRWSQQLHPIGHYANIGRFRELSESLDQRVQLAGDFHAPQNLESATAAGEQAARRLLAALAQRSDAVSARAQAMRQAAGRRA